MCNIAIGEQIEFCCQNNVHNGDLFTVADDKHIKYNDELWSLTALAKELLSISRPVQGPRYFKYKGEWLNDIRRKMKL